MLALVSIFVFLFSFQNTSGAVTWLYCSEVAVDAALGLVGTTGYAIIFVVTLTINPLFEAMGQASVFLMFGIISILWAIWMQFKLRETSGGLTDKEKKTLYVPEDLLLNQVEQKSTEDEIR